MFTVKRPGIIQTLRKLQASHCCYTIPGREKAVGCDCKYGGPKERFGSEQSGCPELATAARLLEVMTDEEYRNLCERAKCIITDWEPPSVFSDTQIEGEL